MIPKTRRKRNPAAKASSSPSEKKRGPKPRIVVEFPEPSSTVWADCDSFHEALAMHIERYGETAWHLHKAIVRPKERFDRRTIAAWIAGTTIPRSITSLEILGRIEKRYRLPTGYLRPSCRIPDGRHAAARSLAT